MSVSMSDFRSLEATRYLSGTAITLALYDHFLNLPKEIQYVWHQPPLFLAVCVLFDVYLREAGLLYFAVVMSGFAPLDKQSCISFTIFAVVYGFVSNASVHSYILFRLYRLWDNRRFVSYVLGGAFVICMIATIISDVFLLRQILSEVQYAELHGIQAFIETCMFTKKSWYFVGSWAPMVAFDLIALALVAWSTLMTPRRQETAIVGILYKQGFYTFLAFLLLRLSRLLSSVFGSAADTTLMPPVTWALDGILSYRLFLTIKEMEYGSRRNWSKYDAGPRTRGNPQVGRQATTILVFEEIEMDSK
ncbi:uncharacterized protein C8Q71DRAFT_742696 [Rhodofomes roseus]|uniref:DUF6533 domain-containing protein n=1 Tax=Rhodofomes roseus TaxID=34475 RepID=A0ABQ8KRS6_9APHY|nr:uncharacterized protein C8Q71DRAFT_742696 [Rhodofomes roseus]KAH9840989.1 hypothetical protein C8Q71DRAFT_742696 [Rhodofomes roseus]